MDKVLPLRDIDPISLTELTDIDVDCSLPISERIRNFVACNKSPYMYKVNGRIVKIVFDIGARSKFEDGIIAALKNIIVSRS